MEKRNGFVVGDMVIRMEDGYNIVKGRVYKIAHIDQWGRIIIEDKSFPYNPECFELSKSQVIHNILSEI